ncbi:MAG: hypothetical protein WBQ43_15935 [Terriglobales bacterium]
MSTSSQSLSKLAQGPDVLCELLHSLSQPLTSLRCSLELSLELSPEEVEEQQSVSVALQQTEKVIGMIQLMREYLDAEQPGLETCRVALAPVLRSVIGELSSIAAVRDIQLHLAGTCTAKLPVQEARLRLALQYLIGALIEAQPAGGKVMLLLGEGPAGTVLRAAGASKFRESQFGEMDGCDREQRLTNPLTRRHATEKTSTSTLRRVRLAIASRVLEAAGASLVFGDAGHPAVEPLGFIVRIPRRVAPLA